MENGHLIAGRYRLRERLGQGGMSIVWRAEDHVLDREVAVKILAAAFADDAGLQRHIHREARAAARLRHTNVVAVYDYGEFSHDGRTFSFVVMELVDGRSLADMLTGGRLPWKVATLVGAQVAAALAAAHAEGIVHRDVKPANVMVTASGVKLVDFGISAAVGALDDRGAQVLGTPAYLAPERIEGGPVRPATDVYALGLLLYVTLSGKMPWEATTVTQMVKAHVYAKPAPLPAIAGIPPEVPRLVTRCLAKQAADRPSSIEVAEILGDLAGLPSSTLLRTAAAPTVDLPAVASPRRTRGVLIAAGAAAALLTAGGLWSAGNRTPPPPQAASPTRCATSAQRPASCTSSAAPSSEATTGAPEPGGAPTPPSGQTTRTIPAAQVRKDPVPATTHREAAPAQKAAASKAKPPKPATRPKRGKPPKKPKHGKGK